MSTIFAKASGQGRSGVAVYRISGPETRAALKTLTGSVGEPRLARRVFVRNSEGDLIDDGLALWFPAPASFTGEDVAELQLHGSPAVERKLAEALIAMGLEAAGPGAFTMRAFSNGKMDLTQAEGLADLLEAETELQHRQAMTQYRGELRDVADAWRRDLIEAMAKLDAAVDFPDEEDVPAAIAEAGLGAVQRVRAGLERALQGAAAARKVSEGVRIAFVGPPNAGKSSLFNTLVGSERALVSDEAGTTRDVVSETVELGGHRVTFLDMAGVRDTAESAVEQAGINRAEEEARRADIRLLCFPAGPEELPTWMADLAQKSDIVVRTKSDLGEGGGGLAVSLNRPSTVEALRGSLLEQLGALAVPGLAPTVRQAALLAGALEALAAYEIQVAVAPELGAEAVRAAAHRLEELTGRIAPDDVLDDIFSSFCIGK